MRVLVLGGYGFIGLEASRRLLEAGHDVVALGRSDAHGRLVLPRAAWISADIATLDTPERWTPLLRDMDAVINASGALQDGLRDNLIAVQDRAMRALFSACSQCGIKRVVQISAPGAQTDSDTSFYRTKATADLALKQSGLNWTILRPGLVWGATATGGTSLIRMLSAIPRVQPLILGDSRVQMIDIEAVCRAILMCVDSPSLDRRDINLVDAEVHTLAQLTLAVRRWHGFPAPAAMLTMPYVLGAALARLGDLAGWLGWRTPLRTTSLRSLRNGVVGDASEWLALGGGNSFAPALSQRPATKQDRLFARTQLLLPLIVLGLSAFWIASGAIGFARQNEAVAVLGGATAYGEALVIAGSLADIALGVALLWRPWAKLAALGMVALTAVYVAAGTLVTPQLWLDPLGPLIKPIPAAILALVCAAMLEER
jgi:uncharacterized protein YbjT (DUF2867 family)